VLTALVLLAIVLPLSFVLATVTVWAAYRLFVAAFADELRGSEFDVGSAEVRRALNWFFTARGRALFLALRREALALSAGLREQMKQRPWRTLSFSALGLVMIAIGAWIRPFLSGFLAIFLMGCAYY
jgi:hypothetical protein